MKNKFTITISDVRGSKSYSFNQLVRKFFWFFFLFILVLIAGGVATILFLNREVANTEDKMIEANKDYQEIIEKKQTAYAHLNDEKESVQAVLDNKLKQIQFLDQTLHGLEDLIDVKRSEEIVLPIKDRVKLMQLTTLEKKIMLKEIPNGRPVGKYQGVSSSYGWRTHPVTAKKSFHRGIDYRGRKGDPIIASANGVIEYAGFHKKSGYGKLIILTHNNGFKSFYGHLSKIVIKTGQVITKGQHIGDIGSTGVSSGPHLHYEISFVQRKLNPAPFIKWNLKEYNKIFKEIKGVPWGSLSQKVQDRVQMVEKQLLLRDVK